MASDILGLFATPQQYEQQRQAAMEAQALQQASLSPMQQGQYGIALGAQQLGRAIGGALGGQDPQLKIIAQRQAIGSQIDFSDPESIMAGANLAAKSGDQALAMHLVDVGNKVESTSSQTALRKAQAQKALNWQQTLTDSAQKRATISTLEEKLASDPTYKPSAQEISQARWILANESKTRTQIDPTTNQLYIIEGLNINDAAPNLAQYLKSIGVTAPAPTAEAPTTTGAQATPVSTPTVQASTIQPAGTQQAPVTIAKGVTAVPTEASKVKAKEEADKQAAKIEEETNAAAALDSQIANIKSVRSLIKETSNLVKPTTTGVLGKVFSIGSTEARELENKNKRIQANAVFEELAKLKSQSKTGATGFGALNLEELRTIQNKAANLDPMSPSYAKDLKDVDDYFATIQNTLSAKSGRAQESLGAKPSPTPVSQAKEAQIKAMVDRAMSDPRTIGTRAQVESVIRSKMK